MGGHGRTLTLIKAQLTLSGEKVSMSKAPISPFPSLRRLLSQSEAWCTIHP